MNQSIKQRLFRGWLVLFCTLLAIAGAGCAVYGLCWLQRAGRELQASHAGDPHLLGYQRLCEREHGPVAILADLEFTAVFINQGSSHDPDPYNRLTVYRQGGRANNRKGTPLVVELVGNLDADFSELVAQCHELLNVQNYELWPVRFGDADTEASGISGQSNLTSGLLEVQYDPGMATLRCRTSVIFYDQRGKFLSSWSSTRYLELASRFTELAKPSSLHGAIVAQQHDPRNPPTGPSAARSARSIGSQTKEVLS